MLSLGRLHGKPGVDDGDQVVSDCIGIDSWADSGGLGPKEEVCYPCGGVANQQAARHVSEKVVDSLRGGLEGRHGTEDALGYLIVGPQLSRGCVVGCVDIMADTALLFTLGGAGRLPWAGSWWEVLAPG